MNADGLGSYPQSLLVRSDETPSFGVTRNTWWPRGSPTPHGDRLFWDVHDRGKAITITLRDENYAQLVIQVDDPDGAVRTIQEARS